MPCVARHAKKLGARMVLDTSGAALGAALEEGVALIKPNLVGFYAVRDRPARARS